MKKSNAYLPLKLALLEFRHGWKHFRIFLACLILGVSVMAIVNILGAIIEDSLNENAKSLMGGDIEVELKGIAANAEQIDYLSDNYGEVSAISTLRTMLNYNDEATIVEVKAVDAKYPLIGELRLNEDISKAEALEDNGVIVDPILLSQLDLKIGSIIKIGNAEFVIRASLKQEPDRVVQVFSFGPRVMMSQDSLQASGLVNTFSLIEHNYRILLNDGLEVNETFEKKLKSDLTEKYPDTGWRVKGNEDGNRGVKRFIDQLMAFLTLSGLSTFLIAGIGIAGSIRSYMERKYNTIAVLKVLGSSKKTIIQTFLILIGILSLFGGLIGLGIALIVTNSIFPLLASMLSSLEGQLAFDLPASMLALWYGILISYIFSVPTLLSACDVKPAILFRSKFATLKINYKESTIMISGALMFMLLISLILNANDVHFITNAIAIIFVAFALFAGLIYGVKRLAKNYNPKKLLLKLAFGNISREGSSSAIIVFAIGISLTVFTTLTLTEKNFQQRLDKTINEKAPSLFMIDIQPDQKVEFEKLLNQYAASEDIMMLPMLRGRISKVDGTPISEVAVNPDIDWVTRSDRGISFAKEQPTNANITQGEWWDEEITAQPKISVDERILSGMNLEIGDTITLNILGEEIEAQIANARNIDYTTFQINFAMVLSHGVVDNFPHSTIATIYLNNDENEQKLVREISKKFSGITTIRTKEVLEIVREVMKNISIALNITVIISLIAGILVLISALNSTIRQRIYDTSMLKILGAKQTDIIKICLAEWILLALATSIISIGLATLCAWLLNVKFRATEFYFMPEVTISTSIACILVICLVGYIGNRSVFNTSPSKTLRNE